MDVVLPYLDGTFDQHGTSEILPLAGKSVGPAPPSVLILYILGRAVAASQDVSKGSLDPSRSRVSKILHAMLINGLNLLLEPVGPLLTAPELA